jgi:Ser/Thr protein kinase RdoA (MazF antagonist)
VALDKVRALVAGYQRIRQLEEKEKETLQLFSVYAATIVSCWRYWKYNVDTPTEKKAGTHLSMLRLAERIDDIPPTEFLDAIFGPSGLSKNRPARA